MERKRYFHKYVTFDNSFVFNMLNVANHYIFKCQSVTKVENGGRIPGFLYELGSFFGRLLKKSAIFCTINTLNFQPFWGLHFSAVLSLKSN